MSDGAIRTTGATMPAEPIANSLIRGLLIVTIRFPFLSGVSSDVIDCQPLRSFAHRFAVIRVPRLFKFACGEQAVSFFGNGKEPGFAGLFSGCLFGFYA